MEHYPDDKEIVDRLKNGDKQVFTHLISRYQQKVFQTCMGFVHNSDDAADLTQEVFIRVYEKISTFKGDSQFSTWLYRLTMNMAINHNRKKKFSSIFQKDDSENTFFQVKGDDDADKNLINRESKLKISLALKKLTNNQRKSFVLSYYQELSNKEVAEVLGMSVKAIESLLFRSRMKLQEYLKGEFN